MVNSKNETVENALNLNVIQVLSPAQKMDLLALYKNEWWTNSRTAEDIERILAGSSFIVGLVLPDTGKLIAFSRILTDHFKFAYIYDVIVAPEYRKKSVGKLLMSTIMQHPKVKNIYSTELVCKKELIPFYERFGFTTDYDFSVSMKRTGAAKRP